MTEIDQRIEYRWRDIEKRLRDLGVEYAQAAVDAARDTGCHPADVEAKLEHYGPRAAAGELSPGNLYAAVKGCRPEQKPAVGFPFRDRTEPTATAPADSLTRSQAIARETTARRERHERYRREAATQSGSVGIDDVADADVLPHLTRSERDVYPTLRRGGWWWRTLVRRALERAAASHTEVFDR